MTRSGVWQWAENGRQWFFHGGGEVMMEVTLRVGKAPDPPLI